MNLTKAAEEASYLAVCPRCKTSDHANCINHLSYCCEDEILQIHARALLA